VAQALITQIRRLDHLALVMFGWVLSLVFIPRLFQKLLIFLGGTQGRRGLSEKFLQVFSRLLLQRFGSQLGTSLRGEDPLDGGKGQGAVATSPLQGTLEIFAVISGKKPQNSEASSLARRARFGSGTPALRF
jgi:hypothetical protein